MRDRGTNLESKDERHILSCFAYAKQEYLKSHEFIESGNIFGRLHGLCGLKQTVDLTLYALSMYYKFSPEEIAENTTKARWERCSPKYKDETDKRLPLKKQIFNLQDVYLESCSQGRLPTVEELRDFDRFVRIFLSNVIRNIYQLRFHELNLYLTIENPQVRDALEEALIALEEGDYAISIKKSSLAFSLALENERLKLDHWKKTGLYDEMYTYLFLFENPEALAFKLQDYSFILLALGTDIEKFNEFQEIIPVVMLTVGDDAKTSVNIGDFIKEEYDNYESAYFCYTFVLETTLMWIAKEEEEGPPVPLNLEYLEQFQQQHPNQF